MTKRHPFNLIEILLALGVIMFGLVCLLGLFPLAAKVTSDATMETYATSAAEELVAYVTDQMTTLFVKDENNESASPSYESNWNRWISKIPTKQPKAMLGKNEDEHLKALENKDNWKPLAGQPYIFEHNSEPGVFLVISRRGEQDPDNSIDLETDTNIDAKVLVTMWKEKIKRVFRSGKTEEDDKYEYGVRLNMKVGWPAERPEAEKDEDNYWHTLRSIHVYSFDLVRPMQ